MGTTTRRSGLRRPTRGELADGPQLNQRGGDDDRRRTSRASTTARRRRRRGRGTRVILSQVATAQPVTAHITTPPPDGRWLGAACWWAARQAAAVRASAASSRRSRTNRTSSRSTITSTARAPRPAIPRFDACSTAGMTEPSAARVQTPTIDGHGGPVLRGRRVGSRVRITPAPPPAHPRCPRRRRRRPGRRRASVAALGQVDHVPGSDPGGAAGDEFVDLVVGDVGGAEPHRQPGARVDDEPDPGVRLVAGDLVGQRAALPGAVARAPCRRGRRR